MLDGSPRGWNTDRRIPDANNNLEELMDHQKKILKQIQIII
jgi:hypothetical protein